MSRLLIFCEDGPLAAHVNEALAPFGWTCCQQDTADLLVDLLQQVSPAAVLIDGKSPSAPAAIAAIRGLPPPGNGVPLLAIGIEARGPGGQLDVPLDDAAFLALLRRWAGPLEEHRLRDEPWNPRYRLIRLLGLEAADTMLSGLRDSLAPALDGEAVSAHRLAGVAGLCGFAELGQAWSRVDRGENDALDAAVAATREAVSEIDRLLR